jgi:3-oxoacyl-[acyl-carrier-protein] synthase II
MRIEIVAGAPRAANGPALSNSFGFGGHNATLIFGSGA